VATRRFFAFSETFSGGELGDLGVVAPQAGGAERVKNGPGELVKVWAFDRGWCGSFGCSGGAGHDEYEVDG